MIKVLTVIGTRPELIKLSEIIKKLDKLTKHTLAHTGQNFTKELNGIFFSDLKLRKPDFYFNCREKTSIKNISKILINTENLIKKINPDAFVVYGDTDSCLSALAAKKYGIPIFHLEAGNRCFDERVPEEINRKIVDHISDYNFPISNIARAYLIDENIKKNTIFRLTSTMFEVIEQNKFKIENSKILKKLKLTKDNYFLMSIHRKENIKYHLSEIINSIKKISKTFKKKIIISCHPTFSSQLKIKKIRLNEKIILAKPFAFTDYCFLQKNALIVISDSGTISEEASILKLKAINFRNTHERPEAMEEGSAIMSGMSSKNLIEIINLIKNKNKYLNNNPVKEYFDKNVSGKFIRILLSHFHLK
tara:strand:+ start:1869 stop:2957 length:1089 start_codon:yes stop_codon:yes gene_type:complete